MSTGVVAPGRRRLLDPARWLGMPGASLLAVAMVLLVGTRQSFTVPFTGLGLSPAQLILFVVAALWVVTRVVGQRSPAGLGVLLLLIVVQLAIGLLSYGLSSNRFLNLDQRAGSDRSIVVEIFATITVVVIATLLRTRREIEIVLRAMLIGGAMSGFFAIVQYATGLDIAARLHPPGFRETTSILSTQLLREGLVRPQGAAAHPLELGAVMTVLIPIGLGVCFSARRRRERTWPWALVTAVIAGGATVSLSRSAFLGVAAALLVMVPRWPVRRAIVAVGAGLGGLILALLSGARLVQAISSLLLKGSQDYSLGSRADGRTYVWEHFAHHFWLGQGPGTYDISTQQILDNQYLSQLMETGVLGLIMLVVVQSTALGYAVRAAARTVASDAAELANGIAGALAAVLVISAVLDTGGFVQIYSLIWLFIGLAGAIWRLNVGGGASGAGAGTELIGPQPRAAAAR